MLKLERLERLEFDNCRGIVSQHRGTLFKKKLHLKELRLWHNENDFYGNNGYSKFNEFNGFGNAVETVINPFCSKSLLKLTLNIITPETIKTVKESCPNIIFLCIKICSEKFLDSTIQPFVNYHH